MACVVLNSGYASSSIGSRYGVIGLSTISRATICPRLRSMVGVHTQERRVEGPTSTYTAAAVPKMPGMK